MPEAVQERAQKMAVETAAQTVAAAFQAASAVQGVPAGSPKFDVSEDLMAKVSALTSESISVTPHPSGRTVAVTGFGVRCTVTLARETAGANTVACK